MSLLMNPGVETDILTLAGVYNANFVDLKLDEAELTGKVFENCSFARCSFVEAQIIGCKFINCEFKACHLSAVQIKNSSFMEVVFDECNLRGINWTKVKWPYIALTSPVQFYRSNISHSSFYELNLKEIIIEECKAHEVDFRGADLSNGSFMNTDFEGSLFMHCKLQAANFTDAINYHISPVDNDIRKAKFSMPDAVNLLRCFDVVIEGI